MPLIECPECGRGVSSSAAACPECAYPVRTGTPPVPPAAVRRPPRPPGPSWWKIAFPLVGRIFLGTMIAGIGIGEEESVAALIGGLIIGGSAIPAWYRARIERLKAGRSSAQLNDQLEARMVELEQRHQEQLADLERMHTGQIAELEERMDFTERLLTKQRGPNDPG